MAKLEKAGLQIKHMRIAAENLEAAGATELAGQIREKADALEKEARAAKARLLTSVAPQGGKEVERIRDEVAALSKEVAQLRNEVKQLGQQLKKPERAKAKKK
jgi:methyl-accepting chemotaxis protein